MSDENTLGLVCSGGGVLGAYQVGVLKYFFENISDVDHSPFKVFSGISCGAINSTFCASFSKTIKKDFYRLERDWKNFHHPNYQLTPLSITTNILKNTIKKEWALLDPNPMREILNKVVKRDKLEEAMREGYLNGVSCVATEIPSGRPTWFQDGPSAFSWQRTHANALKVNLTPEHVISSCSIPFFFPMQDVEGQRYLDGGVNVERPMASALSMGANKLLVISMQSPEDYYFVEEKINKNVPEFITVGQLLLKVFLKDRVHSETDQIDALNRMFYQAYGKALPADQRPKEGNAIFNPKFKFKNYNPVEIVRISPSQSVHGLFRDFCSTNKKYKNGKTELMFHRDFISELIELGYQDAKIKHDELSKIINS